MRDDRGQGKASTTVTEMTNLLLLLASGRGEGMRGMYYQVKVTLLFYYKPGTQS